MLSRIVNFASVHVRTLPIYEYLKLPIGDAPSYKMMLPSPRCEFASDTMFQTAIFTRCLIVYHFTLISPFWLTV